jgi:hypothetical protein
MFENPGQKIKTWANAVFVIGLIVSIIGGIVIIAAGSAYNYRYDSGGSVLSGLLVIGLGCLGSFLSSLLLYAAGTLVEAAENADRRLENIAHIVFGLNAELNNIRKAMPEQRGQTAAQTSPDNAAAPVQTISGEKPVAYHGDSAPSSSAQPAGSLPGHYVIVDRSKPSFVCPICATEQLSNRNVCMNCGIPFVSREKLAEHGAASTPPPENGAFQVRVNRSGLSLHCPMCDEYQPSNLERCQQCGAQFLDAPK